MRNYRFPKEDSNGLANLEEILLNNRGIVSKEDQEIFLSPNYETGRHDPFLLNDMDKAVSRIREAISEEGKIGIFSDYDCDGIPGAVVLHDFFKAAGYSNFVNYIPHRHYEGFGLSIEAVDKLREQNVSLIITIDCGTVDVDAISYAKEKGVDVIVTDHHEPKSDLPNAVAIVNPKVGTTYPFPDLCGAGVVFKLVEGLLEKGDFGIKAGQEKWLLDMVGLATVSDMVPLVGENRVFAHYGLKVLRKSRRPGLQHLLRKARANQSYLTEDDIGFTIGPRINAASRMDDPEDAFFMLSATDEGDAKTRVDHLEKLNNERKGMVAAMTKELNKRMSEVDDIPEVLVFGNPDWRPALVGLAANKLAEEYSRPTFLWGRDGNGSIKGSCRSDGTNSVIAIMNAAADSFKEHGGHHASGGFTVNEERVHDLPSALVQAKIDLGEAVVAKEDVVIDSYLNINDVTNALVKTLSRLSPYGTGNAKPIFAFKKVAPSQVEVFGKQKEHLKLVFETAEQKIEAIAFFASVDSFQKVAEVGQSMTMIAHVEESFFMGRRQIRLRIVDIL